MLQRWLAIWILAAGMLAACAGNAPASTATPAPASPTAHNAPTPTTAPTNTPAPTPTLTPSPTPSPTLTPNPTHRNLTELNPNNETEMQTIQKAVADAVAGGAFLAEDELKAKLEAGELKVVRDKKTGAVMVLTKEALNYLDERGQTVAGSDFARILRRFDGTGDDYQNWRQKATPVELQAYSETEYKAGRFLPLPPEWMTLTARINPDTNQPEVVAVLPPYIFAGELIGGAYHKQFFDYPDNQDGRIYGDPMIWGVNKKAKLAVILPLPPEEGSTRKQAVTVPYRTANRWMRALVTEDGRLMLGDEHEVLTHELGADGKWHELERYEVYGRPAERMAQVLQWKLNEKRVIYDMEKGTSKLHTNVLGLDEAEVELAERMLKEGEPIEKINEQVKSFYILTDAQGEPRMVAVVGGEYGLTPEQLINLQKAVAGIEAVDPGRLAFLADQFGARFISSKTSFIDVDDDIGTFSSNDGVDTIIAKTETVDTVADFIDVLLAEGGEVHGGRCTDSTTGKLTGNLHEYNNFGHFAMQWMLGWLNMHGNGLVASGVITQKELQEITDLVTYNLERYKKAQ